MKTKLLVVIALVSLAQWEASALPVREALAMLESGAAAPQRGAADKLRGGSGEVSRFQIMPEVWRQYSSSREYDNPEVAWGVAQRILADRTRWFQEKTGRQPTPSELYLLWNRPGYFQTKGFALQRVAPLYKERAERFANLCELKER
jgi:hypothetical protein